MSVAATGIKKLYHARGFILGGSILAVAATVLTKQLSEGWQAGLGLAGLVLLLIGAVLEILALKTAAPADKGYEYAFSLALGGAIAAVVAIVCNIIWKDHTDSNVLYRIISIFTINFVMISTIKLLKENGAEKEAASGKKVWYLIAGTYLAEAILDLVVMFVKNAGENTALLIIAGIVGVVGVVGEFLYLWFLGKAWKKL